MNKWHSSVGVRCSVRCETSILVTQRQLASMRIGWSEGKQWEIEVSFKKLAQTGYAEILDEGGDDAHLRIAWRQDLLE